MRDYRAWLFIACSAAVAAACGDDDSSPAGGTDAGSGGASASGGASSTGGKGSGGKATGGAATGGAAAGGGPSTGGADGGGTEVDGGTEGGTDAGPVDVTGLTWVENTTSVLVGALEFSTSGPATVKVSLSVAGDGGGAAWEIPTPSEAGTTFSIRVVGLHASTQYTATVTATAVGGSPTTQTVSFATKALPADFPVLTPTITTPASMQGGWTLLPIFRWTPTTDLTWGYLIAVDEAGLPVWYQPAKRPADVRVLASGDILYNEGDDDAVLIDVTGKELGRWKGDDLGIDTIHHEIFPLPGGNYVALGTELRTISGYSAPWTDTNNVVGDLIVEFDPARTGPDAVVHKWSVLDVIDPLRTLPDFATPFWDAQYPADKRPTRDWSHGNAVILDPTDDSFLVSLRHQDYIIKVDRKTGKLKWKFGKDGDFTMEGGDANFQYHQHAPELESNGHLLVFDNGNGRPGTSGTSQYSRAVEFELDTSGGDAGGYSARVVWEYKGAAPFFAPFVGDANLLGNGNVLVTEGGLVADVTLGLGNPNNQKFARIVEVTHTSTPEVVFQLDIKDNAASNPTGYTVYRSLRIAPLK